MSYCVVLESKELQKRFEAMCRDRRRKTESENEKEEESD